MAATHAAFPRVGVTAVPTTRVPVMPAKPNMVETISGAGGAIGFALVAVGVVIMGLTIYGTQRTTAQILMNQPAAVQNPKKGLMIGVKVSGVGAALVAVMAPICWIAGKVHR